jgi:hypothetical protein
MSLGHSSGGSVTAKSKKLLSWVVAAIVVIFLIKLFPHLMSTLDAGVNAIGGLLTFATDALNSVVAGLQEAQ